MDVEAALTGDVSPLDLPTEEIFRDDFVAGFSAGTPDAPWRLRPVGEFAEGDGIVTTGPGGLVVVPKATHPLTGEPAFSDAPQPLGDADHLRWAATVNRTAPAGFAGFDLAGGALTVTAELSVAGFGLAAHPYGDVIADPRRDLRVGAALLVTVDLESGMVLDFIVTDGCVLAVYERLGFPGTDHAAFSYAVPVLDRVPGDRHRLTIAYDAGSGTAHWFIGDTEVLQVDRLGARCLDERFLKRDNGKVEKSAAPRQLTCGLGLFADRLFGQGFRLSVGHVEVRSAPLRTDVNSERRTRTEGPDRPLPQTWV